MRLGEIGDHDLVDPGAWGYLSPRRGGRPRPPSRAQLGSRISAAICGALRRSPDEGVRVYVFRGGFDQLSEHGPPGFQRVLESQHGLGDLACFGAGQADNANSAASGRGGDGDNGVVEVHERRLLVTSG